MMSFDHIFDVELFTHLTFYCSIIPKDYELFELNLKFDFIEDQFDFDAAFNTKSPNQLLQMFIRYNYN
jgi:hypothetical protein